MTPPLYILDQIRKLQSGARISFVEGVMQLERVLTVPKTKEAPGVGSADDQFGEYKLAVPQSVLGEDHQNFEVYRLYKKLPGLPLKTVNAIDQAALGGRTETITTTVGADAPEPTGGFGVLAATKQQIDGSTAVVITKTADMPFPVLEGGSVDPQTGIVVLLRKTIVPAGTPPGVFDGF